MLKKCCAATILLVLAMLVAPALWAESQSASPSAGAAVSSLAGQDVSEGDADAADVVVLLDTSQSTMPYFQDVTDYVISSVVKDYLRRGDTFHLLSFGETAQSEIAQRVETEADVKAVLGRLYLLYPLARYTDLVGALSYLYQYLADLPESRRKVVIVITDGVNNPPPASPTFGMRAENVTSEIEAAASRIRANGWPVHIIKLPFPKPGDLGAPKAGSPEAQGKSYLDVIAKALGAAVSEYSPAGKADIARKSLSLPSAQFPGPLGKEDYAFSFPVKFFNGSDSSVGLELDHVRSGDVDILSKKLFMTLGVGRSGTMDVPVLLPDSMPQGETKLELRLHFANGVRVSPDSSVLEFTLARSPVAAFLRSGAPIALFIVLVALIFAAIFAIIAILRRMPKRVEGPIAAAVLASKEESRSASSAERSTASARQEALSAAATSGAREEEARSSASSAAQMAARVREEAAKSADLLAQAARVERQEAIDMTRGRRTTDDRARAVVEQQTTVESSKAALIQQNKAENERTVAILAQASGRRQPAKKPSADQLEKTRAAASAYAPRVVKPGTIQLELIVEEQNRHIGTRNIHSLSAGSSKSVGGGASDFLIFLVSVPRRSAEIHFDGEKLTFVPLHPELFPELAGPIEDCLGKDIPMISKGGYPMTLRFTRYEKPSDKVNKLLHCIDTQGL
jgi:hypothetical protein